MPCRVPHHRASIKTDLSLGWCLIYDNKQFGGNQTTLANTLCKRHSINVSHVECFIFFSPLFLFVFGTVCQVPFAIYFYVSVDVLHNNECVVNRTCLSVRFFFLHNHNINVFVVWNKNPSFWSAKQKFNTSSSTLSLCAIIYAFLFISVTRWDDIYSQFN